MSGWNPEPLLHPIEATAHKMAYYIVPVIGSEYYARVGRWHRTLNAYMDRRQHETFRR